MNRLATMWRKQAGKRTLVALMYGALCFSGLRWFYGDDSLCNGPADAWRAEFFLAAGMTLLDLALSFLASLTYSDTAASQVEQWMLALMSAIVMGGVLVFLPGLLYIGYGHFWLEGTSIDVSCLFREGAGITFPIVVAPSAAALSFMREIIVGRWLEKSCAMVSQDSQAS